MMDVIIAILLGVEVSGKEWTSGPQKDEWSREQLSVLGRRSDLGNS